jgi:Co/Zn/Cd efflux system component
MKIIGNFLWAWADMWRFIGVVMSGAVAIGYYYVASDAAIAIVVVMMVALSHIIAYSGGMKDAVQQSAHERSIAESVILYNKAQITLLVERLEELEEENSRLKRR